jgi:hypothetical protein
MLVNSFFDLHAMLVSINPNQKSRTSSNNMAIHSGNLSLASVGGSQAPTLVLGLKSSNTDPQILSRQPSFIP